MYNKQPPTKEKKQTNTVWRRMNSIFNHQSIFLWTSPKVIPDPNRVINSNLISRFRIRLTSSSSSSIYNPTVLESFFLVLYSFIRFQISSWLFSHPLKWESVYRSIGETPILPQRWRSSPSTAIYGNTMFRC